MKGLIFLGLFTSSLVFAQQDSIATQEIAEVAFTKRLPVSKEVINVEKDLASKNLGQDLPILLKNQTSVISTSDAGNGVGYTGFRIRGVAGTSINVMMNGVPYNDSESQGTFFVDVPDLASSASQIIIQRGVGTSSNGVASFGASVNILSKNPDEKPYFLTQQSFGSFNTRKHSFEAGSGKFWNNRLSVSGRYSFINSDGYIDRAFSKLNSYKFSALFEEKNTKVRFITFGGKEKTYQAWNGIDKKTWETNPRFNFSGAVYDQNWENIVGFYDNETDNYRQNHYHLLWQQKFNENWSLDHTFHYTKGRGYYENYKQDAKFSKYNLPNIFVNGTEVKRSDFIRKKWLDNDFYGLVSTFSGKYDYLNLQLGVAANQYFGRHFGEVSGVFFKNIQNHEYYRNRSVKNEISGYAKAIYQWEILEFFGDLQIRNIAYDTKLLLSGDGEGADLNKNWNFFNPKFGISVKIPNGKIFTSYARAHREPNRDDLFANPETKPETLHDFEWGIEQQFSNVSLSFNAYLMNYINQLVLSGQINDIGEFIKINSGKSMRMGIELAALAKLSEKWNVSGNLSLSRNKNFDFKIIENGNLTNLGKTTISFSPSIIANASVQYFPVKNVKLIVTNQFVGEQYLDNTQKQEYVLPSYFLTDFNATYDFQIKKHKFGVQLLLNNILDKKYVNNGYIYEGPYYFSQAGRNFMLGISYKID